MALEKNPPRQNRVREALERIYDQHPPHFAEYLRRFREDPTSRVFAPLAEAYRRMGRVDEAISLCREGLEHHPDFHGGRVALAKCFIDKKRYEEAKNELLRVVQGAPENLLAQRLLGDTHLMLQNRHEALHCYKMALLLAPQDMALNEKVYALEKSLQAATEMEALPTPVSPPSTINWESAISTDDMPMIVEAAAKTPEPTPNAVSMLQEESSVEWESPMVPMAPTAPPPVVTAKVDDFKAFEEDTAPAADPETERQINHILGFEESDTEDESFRIQHVSSVFEEGESREKEITTETLGDLYFSQGQFDKSLRIFEKIARNRQTDAIKRKVEACRAKLGVDKTSLARTKQITVLQQVLQRLHEEYPGPYFAS